MNENTNSQNNTENYRERASEGSKSRIGEGKEMMNSAKEVAQEGINTVTDKMNTVTEKAGQVASSALERGESAISTVGEKISNIGSSLKETLPQDGGKVSSAAVAVADSLRTSGEYLQTHGLQDMSRDLSEVIRKYPVPSLWVGVGVGFLIGQALTSSRRY